ncbi:ribonuclease D [Candidatus Methylocalor cossyra]|uniref:Ribonuclease D n=1 Tax=Candidatus Methylocalor cossyra TaxID=3108543 RepID=A0ABM9NEZ3_9GAMM
MNFPPRIELIETTARLREFCAQLADAPWIAVDTEFLREKTYYPKFCLAQIATQSQVACIDPLAIDDLDPLADVLFHPGTIKIFHAARQDLEVFYHIWKKLPAPIFDTQIAAPLIGLPEQVSYATLVGELLGVSLGKNHTRTDWSARPLSAAQLRYAADDAIYLAAAYQALRGRLEALGRLDWLDDEFNALLDPTLYENSPEQAWQRIGQAQQLQGRALTALQTLAAWREDTAREQDIPRGWVLKDEVMLDLVKLMPNNLDELRRIRGLDERALKRYGATLCRLLQQNPEPAQQALEVKAPPPRRTPEQEAVLDLMSAVVRHRAGQHTLNPAALATRKDLEQLLETPEQSRLRKGWRRALAGEELEAILRGECQVTVADGRLQVRHHA